MKSTIPLDPQFSFPPPPEFYIEILIEDAQIYISDGDEDGLPNRRALPVQRGELIGPDLHEADDDLIWAHENHSHPVFPIDRFEPNYFRVSATAEGIATDFIAVRFDIDGEVHYGWILVSVSSIAHFGLYGWAYESEPDTAIRAGATTDEVYSLQITCQKFSSGSAGMGAWLTWRGAIIGNRYLMEYSDDLIEWKQAREEIVARNKLITARSTLLPHTEEGNTGERYFRVRDLGEE